MIKTVDKRTGVRYNKGIATRCRADEDKGDVRVKKDYIDAIEAMLLTMDQERVKKIYLYITKQYQK